MSHSDNGGEPKDCHSIVKSSGLNDGKKRHVCCEMHRKRLTRVSVACQTENSGFEDINFEANCSTTTSAVASPKKTVDGSKPEGTLRLMIKNFRNMTDTVRGPGTPVNGVPWKIMVMPRQHVMQKKGTQKCLGFFLQCCPDAYSDSWSCQAAAELRLISQKSGVPNFTRKTNHVYTAKENDWGYSCFMTWADILDENQGYIKDDKVILEVYVKAEPAKNVLTRDAFEKKILDYMRLADLQSSRGLIDKAIEVNQSAMKFCKDKDEQCKGELEVQKQKLIEMKLKQSIERIEKGKQPGTEAEDDGSANLNVLRQALSGNLGAFKRNQPAGQPAKGNEAKAKKPANKDETKSEEQLDQELKKEPSGEQVEQELIDGMAHVDLSDDDGQGGSGYGSSADSDDEDALCDTCLQEQLETIMQKEDVSMTESGCQTEPLAPRSPSESPNSQQRLSPVGATQTNEQFNWDEVLKRCKSPKRRLSEEGVIRAAADGSDGSKTPRWTAEKEAALLDLITQESRASLDSIKDTLERLVAFQVNLEKGEELPPGLELDLAQLSKVKEPPMDVIEIPTVDIPDTDVVDLASDNSTEESDQPPPPPPKMGASSKEPSEELETGPFEYTEDEYYLIRHAKEIVETKAEELVNKYSQLIEQSEATRLAETVKKVEKRMKDIEKQTMTCRKELADECERHYKEEQKLIKVNKQLRSQFDAANDRIEKLNNQLKDRKAEIKKLEKRLKIENQTSAENQELMARIETLEKELANSQKKQNDDTKRHQRETQSLIDTKKQLQSELNSAAGDIERLNTQVEEKTAAFRKMEHRFETDRKQTNASLKDAVDRAKKAEVNLLEFKLEMGTKMLQRAQDDCQNNIKHLDFESKRYMGSHRLEEAKQLQNYMSEWQKTREKIGDMILTSKNEFGQQIEAVRSGKQLTSLPVLEVPKPPPPPKLSQPTAAEAAAIQQARESAQEPNKRMAPIGARPTPQSPAVGHQTPLSNGPVAQEGHQPTLTPISLPANYHEVTPPGGSHSQMANGFSPWSDPLQLAWHMGGGSQQQHQQYRTPVTHSHPHQGGWSDGWGTLSGPAPYTNGGVTSASSTVAQPHVTQSMTQQTAGQWGVGWGYQQVTQAPAPSPPAADKPIGARPTSRTQDASPGSQALLDSRGSSPITAQGDRGVKKLDALMEQLRATFPTFAPDQLRDYVYHFKNQRPGKSLKGLSVEDALKGVVQLVMSQNKNKQGWSQSPGGVSMSMDTFAAALPRSLPGDQCLVCRGFMGQQQNVTTLKCKHRFHTNCVQEWLSSQQSCPSCGKFNPSPDDFPDLS